jgi:hypothetical protein
VIACLRTGQVPNDQRAGYLERIRRTRRREAHAIVAELVHEPTSADNETVVLTLWPSHQVFDAQSATPERDALTASDVHQSIDYRPTTRDEIAGGYLNRPAVACHDPGLPSPPSQETRS